MKRNSVEELDYKSLQKKCKELKLKAVGDTKTLQTRLFDYFKSNSDENQTSCSSQTGSSSQTSVNKEDLNTVVNEIEKLSLIDEIPIVYIDPNEVSYTDSEGKTILQLGILVCNAIKENINENKCVSINKLLLHYSEIIPECKIKTRRKVILINAILTLFQEEIKYDIKLNNTRNQQKSKDSMFKKLDELIQNGRETYESIVNKTKKLKPANK
jgi:hypothetical protein